MARNLAAISNPHAFLNFHESADLHIVSEFAPVQVREREDFDALAEFYVGRNPLEHLVRRVHAATISRVGTAVLPWPFPISGPMPVAGARSVAWPFPFP